METYSISIDFGGTVPNIGQLHNEIVDSSIAKNLYGVTSYEDVVDISFDATLSGPEKTTLDGLVAAHVPVYIPSTPNSLNIIPKTGSVKSSSYTRIAANLFPGTTYATAKSVSYSTATSYDIQIYDKNNQQILLTANLTNSEESIQDLGVLSNLSVDQTQIEISVKKTGGGKAYIESIIICYN